ncbi:hypothetical protein QZH41_009444 [Actinostola sp. cb2023]|nr:hypothetical protein QZH41_009444 [Actinostola sp. cb2023]
MAHGTFADGSVVLWDTREAKPAKRLADPSNYDSIPYCLDWSPLDSSIFATGFEDGSVHVYSIKDTTKVIFSYTPHTRAVNRVAFSPRSPEWLASVSDDTLVHVQNVIHNMAVLRNDTHSDFVRGLSWSPLDDSLLTSGWDKAVVTHMCGLSASSDLAVEFSKSQNTSVISVDSEPPLQVQVNGDLKEGEEETMDVADVEQVVTNGYKSCESKMEEVRQETS